MLGRNNNSPRLKSWAVIILLLNSVFASAGDNVRVKGHKFILLPYVSGIWQKSFFGEADIGHIFNIHYVSHHPERTLLANIKAGAEFNLDFKQELYAPKVSAEADLTFVCIRAGLEDYTQGRLNKVYVTPEAGLTFAGFISVCYGYNQPVLNSGFTEIKPHRISVNLLLPIKLSGSAKYKR